MVNIRFNTDRAKFIRLDVFKLGPERSGGQRAATWQEEMGGEKEP
jgi:hypothetical protein